MVKIFNKIKDIIIVLASFFLIFALFAILIYNVFSTHIYANEKYKMLHYDKALIGLTYNECVEIVGKYVVKNCHIIGDNIWCISAGSSVGFLGTHYYSLHVYNKNGIVTKTKIVEESPRGG